MTYIEYKYKIYKNTQIKEGVIWIDQHTSLGIEGLGHMSALPVTAWFNITY